MELEYKNGVRLTKLIHEKTPLEIALDRYDELAKKHYSLKNKSSTLTQREREAELKKSEEFLRLERGHLDSISDVQAALQLYREEGMKAVNGNRGEQLDAVQTMRDEDHHKDEIKKLETYMRAEGVPKPSPYHTAHHIVPGKGRWQQILISKTRTHLHARGVRINDPANGVYLVRYDKYVKFSYLKEPNGHLRYHTSEYEIYVSNRIRQINDIDFIKTELQIIGRLLQANEPKDAIAKIKQRINA